jgi:hypothetical protein
MLLQPPPPPLLLLPPLLLPLLHRSDSSHFSCSLPSAHAPARRFVCHNESFFFGGGRAGWQSFNGSTPWREPRRRR